MNQIATTERNSMNSVAMTAGPSGSSIAPQSLGDVVRFAEVMCRADIALPKHLRGNAGACMAVAMQALEWQMSPFAVASKSYEVGGRIAYEAQLIAAVVNTRSGIRGRLKYEFEGEGPTLTCKVTGILDGEECVYISPAVGSITTKNSPLWKSDPQQQLGYFSARSWARRHCPEVILGVYDREEVEQLRGSETAKDITPSLSERLAIAKVEQHGGPGAQEGFDRAFVDSQTAERVSEPAIEQEPSSSDCPSPEDAAAGEIPEPPAANNTPDSSQERGEEAGDTGAADGQSASSASNLSEEDRAWLVTAAKMLTPCAAPGGDSDVVRRQYAGLIKNPKLTPKTISDLALQKAVSISKHLVAVCNSEIELNRDLIAGIAQCEVGALV